MEILVLLVGLKAPIRVEPGRDPVRVVARSEKVPMVTQVEVVLDPDRALCVSKPLISCLVFRGGLWLSHKSTDYVTDLVLVDTFPHCSEAGP